MSTYSCLTSTETILNFQKQIVKSLQQKYPLLYNGDYINLDFHSIPHYGNQSEMEKVWAGAKHKTMKGADTVIAQDAQSNMILYTRADILRKEESEEVLKFVDYWKQVNKTVEQTLVYEQKVKLPKCQNQFRQIAIKDNGREKPTLIITNDKNLSMKSILEVYARRWRIENKLAELVAFFNLNALSSPLMIRIHFDMLWTMIADTLYHIFAQDLRRFEKNLSPTIFKKFINFPGKVIYDGENFTVKIRKRAYTPVLKDVLKLQSPITVPWLDNKKLKIIWTP